METNRKDNKLSITYTTGNLLDSTARCLVNPVNTVGIMGKGLALEFKHRYPQMFQTYKKHCNKGALQVGRIMFYSPKDDSRIICLFPTKEHWRNKSQLSYIESGLVAFVKYYKEWEIDSVAFPKLGCGNGGLDWEQHVQPLMEQHLNTLDIPVEVYI